MGTGLKGLGRVPGVTARTRRFSQMLAGKFNNLIGSGLTIDGSGNLLVDDTVYVPYTGATANVDLGTYNLTTTGTLAAGATTITGTLQTGNITIGTGAAGVDYTLTFNGEDDNCVLTYDEDNNKLNFGDTNLTTSGLGTFGSLVVNTDTLVVNVSGYTDRVGIGTATPTAGYKLDVAGFIISNETVDQETCPSIYVSQLASTLQDGSSGNTGTDEAFDNIWEAIKFEASDNHQIRSFGVRLKRTGVITNSTDYIRSYIYSDNAGVPGSQIGGSTYSSLKYGTLTTSFVEYPFYVGTANLTVGGYYWLILKQGAAPAGGTVSIDRGTSGTALHAFSANGINWTAENNKWVWHKLYGRTYHGVYGYSTNNYGIRGYSTNNIGIEGYSVNNVGIRGISANNIGVYGYSTDSYGILGSSTNNYGIRGSSTNNVGIYGYSENNVGIYGYSVNSYGIRGSSTNNYAAYFTSPSGKGVAIAGDDLTCAWGAAQDATIYYDGTDLIIDPKVVGTGGLNILGNLTFIGAIGLPYASIYIYDNAVAQTIGTGATFTKLTGTATNGSSNNCTADGANTKITITKAGVYEIIAHFSGMIDTANTEFEGAIFVDGTIQNSLKCKVEFVAADKSCSSSISGLISIATNKDLDFRVRHDDGGDVDLTIVHANISVIQVGG